MSEGMAILILLGSFFIMIFLRFPFLCFRKYGTIFLSVTTEGEKGAG